MPIWERQEKETDKSFAAFVIYRDMGIDRSLQKAADVYYGKIGAKRGHFEVWSSKFDWVARCQAYDKDWYEKRQERKEQLQLEVEETLESDWRTVRKLINSQLEKYEKGNLVLKASEIRDLIDTLKKADDMIRRTAGLPDRISESKTDHTSNGKELKVLTASELSDDDLARIIQSGSGG